MSLTALAGLAGFGFVLVAIAVNAAYLRGGLPMPSDGRAPEAIAGGFAAAGAALKRPSVLAPAGWLFTTVFAAGLLSVLWHGGTGTGAWALVGFAGVLMQNVTFTGVEALRFALAGAAQERAPVAGLWTLSGVLFGFNQVFLATALLGFTVAGDGAGLIPGWHAWLGYVSAALLFVSSSATPYTVGRTSRVALTGLVGWLGWAVWIVAYGVTLLRL